MMKKQALAIAVFIILAIGVSFLVTGCPLNTDSLYGLKVTGDDTGGTIAIYEEKLDGDVYVQKISPEGNALWGEKGLLLGSSHSQSYSYSYLNIVNDGSGGAIVAWPEIISANPPVKSTYHIERVDSNGKIVWLKDLQGIDQLVTDGSGGVIIDSAPDEKSIMLNRIDSHGSLPWGENGVLLPRQGTGTFQQIAADGSGGAVVIWEELHYPPEAGPGETFSTGLIYSQRINSQGEQEWGKGVLVYTAPEGTYADSPRVIGDGAGGAIIVWQQVPNQKMESGSPEALTMDVLVQRVDPSGKILWQPNGLPLEINKAAGNAFPIEPIPVSDGSGGAIIIWRDSRNIKGNTASLYAQRIDSSGNIMWQAGGIDVSLDAINPSHMIISDGAGGAIVSYFYSEPRKDLHVQKVDADGKTAWPEDGVLVSSGDYSGYSVAPDGQGGAIVGWSADNSAKAYIQRINIDGGPLWGENGIRLNP